MEISKVIFRPGTPDANGNEFMTWRQLKAFLNTQPDTKLTGPVRWWGDEKGGTIHAISEAMDDLINPSGDGVETRSFYAESDDPEDREIAEDEPVVMGKGSLIFEVD